MWFATRNCGLFSLSAPRCATFRYTVDYETVLIITKSVHNLIVGLDPIWSIDSQKQVYKRTVCTAAHESKSEWKHHTTAKYTNPIEYTREKLHIDYVKCSECVYGVAPQCPCFDRMDGKRESEKLNRAARCTVTFHSLLYIHFAFGQRMCYTQISGSFFFIRALNHFHLWKCFDFFLIAHSSFAFQLLFELAVLQLDIQEINHFFRKQVTAAFMRHINMRETNANYSKNEKKREKKIGVHFLFPSRVGNFLVRNLSRRRET